VSAAQVQAGQGERAEEVARAPLVVIAAQLRLEIAGQARRWRLWTPVAFGLGVCAYLALPVELPLSAVLLAAMASIAIAFMAWRWRAGGPAAILAALLAFAVCGGLTAQIRAARVAGPIAPTSERAVQVDGFVVDVINPGASGARVLLAPVSIEGLSPLDTPRRLRVTIDPSAVPGPGASVRLQARLNPPPPPVSPGSYDFARDAWFDGIGGSGFAQGQVNQISLAPPPWRLRLVMAINAMRWSLARQIVAQVGPKDGGLAAAMVTGHEAWIPADQVESMRVSGLTHIISISGLHMAIVGGFVFASVRLAIALWPWAALRVPGKKIAAAVGMIAIGGYLVLSGAPPPAERAAITAFVAFGAVLVERRPFSLHALAVAALLILLMQPEAAVQPGFQMSFAATAALVALAEIWPRPLREIASPLWIKTSQGFAGWIALSIGISFVAGAATAPFAMQHFNRIATYGLPANLLVAPLSSFIFMPALALGAVLTPLGLGGPFLAVAGWGIGIMTDLSAWIADLPWAQLTIASAPPVALVVSFLGLMMLCLWNGRLRWIGLPLALAVNLWPRPPAPDLWIASDGGAAAVRDGDAAVLTRPDVRRFAVELWMRRRGLDEATPTYVCARYICTPTRPAPVILAQAYARRAPAPEALSEICRNAEVVVLRGEPVSRPESCDNRLLLTARDFARGGAAEAWRTGEGGWRIVWTQDVRGQRPWSRVSDSGE
jgi:competence protein ComEC